MQILDANDDRRRCDARSGRYDAARCDRRAAARQADHGDGGWRHDRRRPRTAVPDGCADSGFGCRAVDHLRRHVARLGRQGRARSAQLADHRRAAARRSRGIRDLPGRGARLGTGRRHAGRGGQDRGRGSVRPRRGRLERRRDRQPGSDTEPDVGSPGRRSRVASSCSPPRRRTSCAVRCRRFEPSSRSGWPIRIEPSGRRSPRTR